MAAAIHLLGLPLKHKLTADHLEDVLIASLVDGQVLTWENATSLWKNKTLSSATHYLLSATHPDTLADSVVAGDLLIGNATPKWARLAKGVNGQVLTLVSGLPAWQTPSGGSQNPVTSSSHKITQAVTGTKYYSLVGDVAETSHTDAGLSIHACVAKGLYLRMMAYSGSNINFEIRVYKNGVATALDIAWDGASVDMSVLANVTFNEGDIITVLVSTSGTSRSFTFRFGVAFA
jgi:hypothetical protein